jgi:hypothetical protein
MAKIEMMDCKRLYVPNTSGKYNLEMIGADNIVITCATIVPLLN